MFRPKYGKWLILAYFFQKMSEIVNVFLKTFLIKILDRSIKIMCKTIGSCVYILCKY